MASDDPNKGPEGPDDYELLLPAKLKRLLELADKTPEQFCDEITRSQQIHERKTVQDWMDLDRLHFPSPTNRQKIVDYFRQQFGVATITTEWLKCPMDEFEANVVKLIEERRVKNLVVPVARKLGKIKDRHVRDLSGKYVLYRHSLRYPEKMVSEIFTLSQSEFGYFDMHLRSSPEEDEKFEDFRGRFFRYGPMYWAILTFCVYLDEKKKIDLMRVVQFPQVERTRDVYMGLMMADANTPTQAVAVRCVAKRISPEPTPISDKDNAQIWIGQRPRGDTDPIIDIETVKRILSSGLKEDQPPYTSTFHMEADLRQLFPPDS